MLFKDIMYLVNLSVEELAQLASEEGLDNTLERWLLNEMEFEAGELTDDLLNEVYDAIMKYYPEIAIAEEDDDDDEDDDE